MSAAAQWGEAVLAASLFAIDPPGIGGISVRALAGPVRDRWMTLLTGLLPTEAPVRRVPLHIADGRLLGGLDLAATLQTGRPVAERGVLADVNGGIAVMAMGERLTPSTAARLSAVIDNGEVVLERDGLAMRLPTRFGVIVLDEGASEEERPPVSLLDRLGFHIVLTDVSVRDTEELAPTREEIAAARVQLAKVSVGDKFVEAICGAGAALGVASLRPTLLAVRVARASAALDGRDEVNEDDASIAVRLVLVPRATQIPEMPADEEVPPEEVPPEEPPADEEPPEQPPENNDDDEEKPPPEVEKPLDDVVLAAALSAMPAGLLAQLRAAQFMRSRSSPPGRTGVARAGGARGRPVGVRRGMPEAGARLNVVETLRNAAPWQPLRRREMLASAREKGLDEAIAAASGPRVQVRQDDFRVTRFKQRAQTTSIFVVDASGSAALHRLAEAKGAVELLLADCYVRRDRVALIAFRGQGADLLLPPTRSLVRAKRSLSGLPGGGGTPLAAGIDAAASLADAVRRRGETPLLVFLTDGRANIGRDGKGGRAQAEQDALTAARALRMENFTALFVDTSAQPHPQAQKIAREMDALYLPLPYADASGISKTIRAASPPARTA
ncbi:magnesium chelatase subunit D [Rhodocyclus tenuis]|uniref:magnesium chelatase subunit D n=1 Tax=Rhodocyclus gracilis TaxID=2929842 RepID=UPI00135460C4|nr:magnesium chelatase subunit D [Rhodocyclus gracilis]